MNGNHDIQFYKVQKRFDSVNVIPSIDFKIQSGERLVLLGPSGCGKTTIMRLIAGLEQPTSGDIYMGGKKVNGLEADERHVAMVFQNYALYPHMSVFDNMAFSLKLQKVSKQEIIGKVQTAAKMLELDHLLNRKPRELSGGQRQRVALARAIIRRAPYFLLDEPLSNLDAQLRMCARNELVELHEKIPTTMVYVTHDQVEAMTIGQRIAVMKSGRLQQIGTPEEIYNRPANVFVATFIGNPSMNIMPVTRTDRGIRLADEVHVLPASFIDSLTLREGSDLLLGIRPEGIILNPKRVNVQDFITVHGEYLRSEYLGNQFIHHVSVGQHRLQVASSQPLRLLGGTSIALGFPWDNIHFFGAHEDQSRVEMDSEKGKTREILIVK